MHANATRSRPTRVVRRGANRTKTIVDAIDRRNGARWRVVSGRSAFARKLWGTAIRTRCSAGFFFFGARRERVLTHFAANLGTRLASEKQVIWPMPFAFDEHRAAAVRTV
jgi:hypothetical protein